MAVSVRGGAQRAAQRTKWRPRVVRSSPGTLTADHGVVEPAELVIEDADVDGGQIEGVGG
jgi:hypothetical protein